eukprot:TRINITY_DN36890_c0_g2_i1.p1 TRINITY_DN36890_c0_g2~~TRINITY_DN36890_c0_g2_i1.p1  ORF type:complete len:559 (+),score=95.55 TRINITY_DN36890_c0_g2_i1:53-1678(+)
MEVWQAFALAGGTSPGPIANACLLGESPTEVQAAWLSGEDWHLLHGLYGGGPVLCRPVRTLAPDPLERQSDVDAVQECASPSISGHASKTRVTAVLQECLVAHTDRCRNLEEALRSAVEQLQKGAWTRKMPFGRRPSLGKTAARKRIVDSIMTSCGGEELKLALQELREVGEDKACTTMEPLVTELCMHEEARIVLVCLQQALQDSDRVGLELWLEQGEAMGLDGLQVDAAPVLGLLSEYLLDLGERERSLLARHAETAELNKEGPAERVWRLATAAFEDEDEATLRDLLAESAVLGIEVSGSSVLLEELRERRLSLEAQDAARAHRARQANMRGSASNTSGPAGAGSWNDPRSWGGGIGDPSNWSSTDDFLNAFRQWRHQSRVHEFGADEAHRMRDEDEDRRRRWSEEEEERSRQRAQDYQRYRDDARHRQHDYFRQQSQQGQYHQGYSGFMGGSGSSSGYQGRSQTNDPGSLRDALQTLGLPAFGTVPPLSDLKVAYKKAAMRAHPDRPHNRNRQQEATAEFQKIKAAFDTLSAAAPGS